MSIYTYTQSKRKPDGGETNTIYIDPTFITNGTGSISNPKNTLVGLTLVNYYTYRFKSNTEYVTSTLIDLSNLSGITITSYGDGEIPKIKFTGAGTCAIRFALSTNCAFANIELYTDLSQSVVALIQLGVGTQFNGGSGNIIAGCKLHDVKQGSSAGGMGIRGGGTDFSIVNCEIYNCGEDGIYARDTVNLYINNCNIHHVNQNYAGSSIGFLSIGNIAGGDAVQIDGTWVNCYIGNTIMDRTDEYTGNKFALILGGATGPTIFNDAIVEHCTFKVKSGAEVTYSVYCGQGNGVIFRYNNFHGITAGLRLTGVYCLNFLIHNNIFTDCEGSSIAMVTTGGYPSDTLIYNNVFARGSGAYSYITLNGGNATLINNIFDDAINAFNGVVGTVYIKTHNSYQDPTKIGSGELGTGEITGDPMFLNAINNNFNLDPNSPCIDAGIDVGIQKDYDYSTQRTNNMGIYFKYGTEL